MRLALTEAVIRTTRRKRHHLPDNYRGCMVGTAQRQVTLITRDGCHLCADAEQTVRRLQAELGYGLEILDVDADPARKAEYSDRVPVVLIDGKEHGYWRIEEARFRGALAGRRWGRRI